MNEKKKKIQKWKWLILYGGMNIIINIINIDSKHWYLGVLTLNKIV